jgi:hypothetical protein
MQKIKHIIIWVLAAIFIVGIATIEILYTQNKKLETDNKRISSNQNILINKAHQYRTSDSLNAYRVGILRLRYKELEKSNLSLKQNVIDLKIRLKDVENIAVINLSSQYHINSVLKDSLKVLLDELGQPIDTMMFQYINYKDKWVKFYQRIVDDSVSTEIKTRDSVVVVQHWTPYKFLWFKWGKKDHKETVKSYNPYSTVDFVMSVELDR